MWPDAINDLFVVMTMCKVVIGVCDLNVIEMFWCFRSVYSLW